MSQLSVLKWPPHTHTHTGVYMKKPAQGGPLDWGKLCGCGSLLCLAPPPPQSWCLSLPVVPGWLQPQSPTWGSHIHQQQIEDDNWMWDSNKGVEPFKCLIFCSAGKAFILCVQHYGSDSLLWLHTTASLLLLSLPPCSCPPPCYPLEQKGLSQSISPGLMTGWLSHLLILQLEEDCSSNIFSINNPEVFHHVFLWNAAFPGLYWPGFRSFLHIWIQKRVRVRFLLFDYFSSWASFLWWSL